MSLPPIRVLAVIPGDGSGTSMLGARRQVESLAVANIEARTFYLTSRTSFRALLQSWRELKREIRTFQPHAVHAQYGTVTALLAAFARDEVPLVITFQGSDLNRHRDQSAIRAVLALFLSQVASLAAAQSICVSAQLRDRLWFRRDRALVLMPGVDLQRFQPVPRDQARQHLGWTQDERVVLLATGLYPQAKGIGLVTQAVDLARAKFSNLRLHVLSTAPPDTVPFFLNAADCLAIASDREGSPNIVREAMACNLPIVSVDVGDVPERLNGVHPSRIVGYNARQFADALVEVLSLGTRSNGRMMVAQYSWPAYAARLRALYLNVAVRPIATGSHAETNRASAA